MKAIGYKASLPISDANSLVDIEVAQPKATGHDLLVKIDAIAVNPVDCKIRQNVAPEGDEHKIIGWDAVGEVVATGEATSLFKPGDKVKTLPSGFVSTIKTIELNGEQIAEAFAPMSVTMTLEDEIDTSRGDMFVRENNVPQIGQDIEVLVTWMSNTPLQARSKVVVKHTTNESIGMVKELKYKIDINTLHRIENIDKVQMNDICRISIRTSKPLFYDIYKKNRQTGSLIIIDEQTNETIGAGMII